MIPVLYSPTETLFTTNGLGGLADCISCEVTEERNGAYTMEIVYPIDGLHFSDIAHSSIIKVIPSDGATEQLFRVYKISKPLNGKVTIEAEHISYQLSFIPVSPFTASNCAGALSGLVTHSMETNPFTVWTDKETSATYKQTLPNSFRSRLGGVQGSILDVYGGEYEFDNYTVKLHASRGSDNGVTLRYGKNITDIKQEENIENTITGICPYWTDSDGNTVTGDIQYAEGADNFPYKRTVVMDFSGDYENQPTKAELEAHARSYISSNRVGVPRISIEVSFIALWQTEEYKNIANLERVKLCDTVTVEFEKLGISAKAKVVETVYDVLKERYTSIEIGESRTDLAKTLSAMQSVVNQAPTEGFMRQAINHANSLLSGGLGGHVVINRNANGEPNEILIMDTDDKDTAVNVIRMNVNGIGFSTTGYDGDYTTAWTIDGHFNADFIKAGTINAIDITGSHITGALMEGSTARFGSGNLQTTLSYGPSAGFDGQNALLISGNDRVAIESTQYQVRVTGRSVYVGTENDMTEASIYIGPSGTGNAIQLIGDVLVRDGRLFGYAGVMGTNDVKFLTYEANSHKYLGVYKDDSLYGSVQLS